MSRRSNLAFSISCLAMCLVLTGCGSDGPVGADGGVDASTADAGSSDAGDTRDGGSALDAGAMGEDAGSPDAGLPDGGPPDGGPPDAGPACEVGSLCNADQPCPEGDRCYGFAGNGFCAHFAPECGGFVMTECAAGRTCLRGGGGDLGYCATPPERRCICDMAAARGTSVDGC